MDAKGRCWTSRSVLGSTKRGKITNKQATWKPKGTSYIVNGRSLKERSVAQ